MDSIYIIPTSEEIQLAIPDIFYNDFIGIVSDTVANIAKSISNRYNIEVNQLLECKPGDVYMAIPKPIDITSKEQLQKYTISQLHEVLSIKGLSLSGSKQILVDRMWDYINNIDNAVHSISKKKKKRKVTKQSNSSESDITSVEDSDSEEAAIVVKREIIYIDKYGKRLKKQSKNTSDYTYIPDNNWVLDSQDNYIGYIEDNRLVRGDPPKELG